LLPAGSRCSKPRLGLSETVLGKRASIHTDELVLSAQGKHEQAEEMHRQVLGLMETVLDKEHLDTLTSMNNLAGVLRDKGKYERAGEIHRQALGLMETVLGKEHLSTLTSINNLALVLRSGPVRASGRDAPINTRAVGDGAGQRASIRTDKHE
jgi:hypothetical protein